MNEIVWGFLAIWGFALLGASIHVWKDSMKQWKRERNWKKRRENNVE